MKIFIVARGCYSSYEIVKLFLEESAAKRYVDNMNDGCNDDFEKYHYSSMDTEDDPEPKELWEITRQVYHESNGHWVKRNNPDIKEGDDYWTIEPANEEVWGEREGQFCLDDDFFQIYLRCENRKKALKIAHERWGMIKVRDDIKPYKRDVYLYYNQ